MVDVGPLESTDPGPAAQPPLEGVEEYVAKLHDAIGPMRTPMGSVLLDIATERIEQDLRYGEQNRRDGTGGLRHEDMAATALGEITTIKDLNIDPSWAIVMKHLTTDAYIERDTVALRAKIIKIAAAAAAWAQCLDRRMGVAAYCEAADAHRMAHVPTGIPPTPAAHDVPGSE